MDIDFPKLGIALAVLIVSSALLLYLFPLTTQPTTADNYDFITHSYKPQTNWTAIIGIGLITIILFFWLVMKSAIDEKSIIRRPITILESDEADVQKTLISSEIPHPIAIRHEHALGSFSQIGFLWLVEVLNNHVEPVYFTLIGETNYRETNLRQRFESPILNRSHEFYDLRGAVRYMTPKERGNLADKLKNLYKELSKEDRTYAEDILKRSYEKAEEEKEEWEE